MTDRSTKNARPDPRLPGGARRPDILLAGCGRWGARILRDLIREGAVVRVADPAEAARREAGREGASGTFADVSEASRFDGAVVATPTRIHGETIRRLASAGAPIFCEKPLAADPAEAAELAREVGGLFVLDKWRYHPAVEMLSDIARNGRLGPVRALRTRRAQPSISGYDVDAIWVLAPHELSIAAEILGDVPPPSAAAGRFRDGDVVAMEAAFGEGRFSFEVAVDAPRRTREIVLECRDGSARWTMDDEHAIRMEREAVSRVPVDTEPPLTREMRALLSYLAGGPPLKTDARAGAEAVRCLGRARELAGITPDGRRSR